MNTGQLILYSRTSLVISDLPALLHGYPKVKSSFQHYTKETSEKKLHSVLNTRANPIVIPTMGLNNKGWGCWGKFSKPRPNEIQIEEQLLVRLETAKSREVIYEAAFFIAVTLLHETVHYCRFKNKEDTDKYEYGQGFERDAFGTFVNEANVNHLGARYKHAFKRLTYTINKDKSVPRGRAVGSHD